MTTGKVAETGNEPNTIRIGVKHLSQGSTLEICHCTEIALTGKKYISGLYIKNIARSIDFSLIGENILKVHLGLCKYSNDIDSRNLAKIFSERQKTEFASPGKNYRSSIQDVSTQQ